MMVGEDGNWIDFLKNTGLILLFNPPKPSKSDLARPQSKTRIGYEGASNKLQLECLFATHTFAISRQLFIFGPCLFASFNPLHSTV